MCRACQNSWLMIKIIIFSLKMCNLKCNLITPSVSVTPVDNTLMVTQSPKRAVCVSAPVNTAVFCGHLSRVIAENNIKQPKHPQVYANLPQEDKPVFIF